LDNFYFCVVKGMVLDFCVNFKTVPTYKKLLAIVKEKSVLGGKSQEEYCIKQDLGGKNAK